MTISAKGSQVALVDWFGREFLCLMEGTTEICAALNTFTKSDGIGAEASNSAIGQRCAGW